MEGKGRKDVPVQLKSFYSSCNYNPLSLNGGIAVIYDSHHTLLCWYVGAGDVGGDSFIVILSVNKLNRMERELLRVKHVGNINCKTDLWCKLYI